jgi:hypothetical protein
VTNAVFGEADGTDVLAERAPPLLLGRKADLRSQLSGCIAADYLLDGPLFS